MRRPAVWRAAALVLAGAGALAGLLVARPSPPSAGLDPLVASALARAPRTVAPDVETDRRAVADAVRDLAAARDLSVPQGYSLEQVDLGSGTRGRALVPLGDPTSGDGVYVVRAPKDSERVAVEIAHPLSDRWTDAMGVMLFARTPARVLLVAGTRRDAGPLADVAHEAASAFAQADELVVGPGWTSVQLHGFARSSHLHDPEVVLSDGDAHPSRLVLRVAAALRAAGFDVGVHAGDTLEDLAATENVQGAWARRVAADFLHVEVVDTVRADPGRRGALVAALAAALS